MTIPITFAEIERRLAAAAAPDALHRELIQQLQMAYDSDGPEEAFLQLGVALRTIAREGRAAGPATPPPPDPPARRFVSDRSRRIANSPLNRPR